MCLSDFRTSGKRRATPATVVDMMRLGAQEVVRAYAQRQCGCEGCTSHAYLSLQALGLALAVRHTCQQISDTDAQACLDEIHRAAERIRAIEDFTACNHIQGRMQ